MTATVGIFRKRLLSYTETFIADQGQKLPRYRPLYCGFQKDPTGLELIKDSTRIILDDHSVLPALSKLLLRSGIGGGHWIKALSEHRLALLHAHFFNDGLDAVKIADLLDLPVITTVHGHDITKHANAVAQSRQNRRFFERIDRVVAVSRFIASQALERGCPENKLVQHYIGIDLDKFTLAKQETTEPSLLFVGRLVEKKGVTYVLQSMQALKSRFPELQLTIVGDGSLNSNLRQEADERELKVEFVGSESAEQIRERLAKCWLFVAPSITADDGDAEGLGMVFLEAQALQTPVISFRSGGVVEAVEDGVTGLLCDEKDVAALSDNIATLLENSTLRHNMGIEGRQRIVQKFDVRKQCAELEEIYDGLT